MKYQVIAQDHVKAVLSDYIKANGWGPDFDTKEDAELFISRMVYHCFYSSQDYYTNLFTVKAI